MEVLHFAKDLKLKRKTIWEQ